MAQRRGQKESDLGREDEWNAFMAAVEAKAKDIGKNPDRALTLMILAGKVAQYDPTIARHRMKRYGERSASTRRHAPRCAK